MSDPITSPAQRQAEPATTVAAEPRRAAPASGAGEAADPILRKKLLLAAATALKYKKYAVKLTQLAQLQKRQLLKLQLHTKGAVVAKKQAEKRCELIAEKLAENQQQLLELESNLHRLQQKGENQGPLLEQVAQLKRDRSRQDKLWTQRLEDESQQTQRLQQNLEQSRSKQNEFASLLQQREQELEDLEIQLRVAQEQWQLVQDQLRQVEHEWSEKLQRQSHQSQQELERLHERHGEVQLSAQTHEGESDSVRQQLAELQQELELTEQIWQEKLDMEAAQREGLEAELAEALEAVRQAQLSARRSEAELASKLEKRRIEQDQLAEQLEDLSEEADFYHTELVEAHSEILVLQERLMQQEGGWQKRYQIERHVLQEQVEVLEYELSQAREGESKESSLAALQAELQASELDFQLRLDAEKQAAAQAQQSLTEAQSLHAEFERVIQQQEQELFALRGQCEQTQEQLHVVEGEFAIEEELWSKEIEQEFERRRVLEATIEGLETDRDRLEHQLRAKEEELERQPAQTNTLIEVEPILELRDQLAAQQQQLAILQAEYDLHTHDLDLTRTELASAQNDLQMAETERENVRSELVERTLERQSLGEELSRAQEDRTQLQLELQELQLASRGIEQQLATSQAELNQQESSLRQARDQQSYVQQQLEQGEDGLSQLLLDNSELHSEVESQRVRVESLQAAARRSEGRIEELELELDARQARIEELVIHGSDSENEISELKKLAREQAEQATDGSSDDQDSLMELEELRIELVLRETELQTANALVAELEGQLSQQEETSQALHDRLDQLKQNETGVEATKRELDEKNALLDRQGKELAALQSRLRNGQLVEKTALQDVVRKLEETRLEFRRKGDDLEAAHSLLDETEYTLQDKDRQIKQLQDRLARQATPDGLAQENERLLKRLADSDSKTARQEKISRQLEEELLSTRERLLEAHNQLDPLETQHSRAEAKANLLKEELTESLKRVQQLETLTELLERENSQFQSAARATSPKPEKPPSSKRSQPSDKAPFASKFQPPNDPPKKSRFSKS